jgi:hypothetical protein
MAACGAIFFALSLLPDWLGVAIGLGVSGGMIAFSTAGLVSAMLVTGMHRFEFTEAEFDHGLIRGRSFRGRPGAFRLEEIVAVDAVLLPDDLAHSERVELHVRTKRRRRLVFDVERESVKGAVSALRTLSGFREERLEGALLLLGYGVEIVPLWRQAPSAAGADRVEKGARV